MAYDDSAHGGSKFEVSSKDIEKQVDKEGTPAATGRQTPIQKTVLSC